jgi:hypothetical protein
MNAVAVFVLVVVTYGGDVSISTAPSLHACQEAQNVALYDETLEQSAARTWRPEWLARELEYRAQKTAGETLSGVSFGSGGGTVRMLSPGDIKRAMCFQDVGANK